MLKRFLNSSSGLLTALFFFGGLLALHRLIMPKAAKALADPAEQSTLNVAAADVIPAIDRFEDDGGKQYL